MPDIDLRGLNPACVTPFTTEGEVDTTALAGHGRWLASFEGVTSIVCNGHAGEGLSMTAQERELVVRTLVEAVDGRLPIIAGIVGDGSKVAGLEAAGVAQAGAAGILLYPAHSWLRFGFQPGGPVRPRRRGRALGADRPPAAARR